MVGSISGYSDTQIEVISEGLARGKRWKSSSVMKGIIGCKSFNPCSRAKYKTLREDSWVDKTGLTASM